MPELGPNFFVGLVSGDNKNWITESPTVNAVALSTSQVTVDGGASATDHRPCGFVRLKITLGGTSPQAQLRIYVTGRGEQVLF